MLEPYLAFIVFIEHFYMRTYLKITYKVSGPVDISQLELFTCSSDRKHTGPAFLRWQALAFASSGTNDKLSEVILDTP